MARSKPSTDLPGEDSFLESVEVRVFVGVSPTFRFWAREGSRALDADPRERPRPSPGPSLGDWKRKWRTGSRGHRRHRADPVAKKETAASCWACPWAKPTAARLAATATLDEWPVAWTSALGQVVPRQRPSGTGAPPLPQRSRGLRSQIGNDFEELSFLRTLADHLDVSELEHGPWHVAEMVLPMLAEIIRAESLILVAAKRDPRDASQAMADRPVVWVGRRNLTEETCRTFIETFGELAKGQPLVRNMFSETSEGQRFPGVRKFVMTSLVKRDRVLGWLVAINHVSRPHDQPRRRPLAVERLRVRHRRGRAARLRGVDAGHPRLQRGTGPRERGPARQRGPGHGLGDRRQGPVYLRSQRACGLGEPLGGPRNGDRRRGLPTSLPGGALARLGQAQRSRRRAPQDGEA